MARAKKKTKKKRGGQFKAKRHVSLAKIPFNGDHGTGTAAANEGTELVPILNEKGENPNNLAHRRRKPQSEYWSSRLSMRQLQAAVEIENAYQGVQSLGSGGDSIGKMIDLQTRVQSSPKPDAVVSVQDGKNHRLIRVMKPIPLAMRDIIEHLFWHGRPMADFAQGRQHYNRSADVKVALDLVANELQY